MVKDIAVRNFVHFVLHEVESDVDNELRQNIIGSMLCYISHDFF